MNPMGTHAVTYDLHIICTYETLGPGGCGFCVPQTGGGAMPALPATDQGIRRLQLAAETRRLRLPEDSLQIEYRDTKTPGLALIVGKRAKTWSLTYTAPTGRRRITIGRYPDVSLADARQEAEAKRVASRRGVDHQAEKREYSAARTVAAIAEEYLEKAARQLSTYRLYKGVIRNDLI